MHLLVIRTLSEQVPSGIQIIRETKWWKVSTHQIYLIQDTASLKRVKALMELSIAAAAEGKDKEM